MFKKTTVELDENGVPLVNAFDEYANRYMRITVLMLFYLGSLTVGFWFTDVLVQSPLVLYASKVLGFIASVIAWIPSFLVGGIVLGQFDFARDVFNLYGEEDFSLTMSLTVLLVPIVLFSVRTMTRTVLSYGNRRILFCVALAGIVGCLTLLVDYQIDLRNAALSYGVSCVVLGAVYMLILGKLSQPKVSRMKHRPRTGFNE